jgi:hypothetical protein
MSWPIAGYRPVRAQADPGRLLHARRAPRPTPGCLVLHHRIAAPARSVADSSRRLGNRGRPYRPLDWQPSRFLIDRGEAARAFAVAEQLGSVNATAAGRGVNSRFTTEGARVKLKHLYPTTHD